MSVLTALTISCCLQEIKSKVAGQSGRAHIRRRVRQGDDMNFDEEGDKPNEDLKTPFGIQDEFYREQGRETHRQGGRKQRVLGPLELLVWHRQ